ncbi:eCIS core domain-containing protein [Tenacibaculum agarivorans]|uniref:eCIS core domain-containing protein n=1 Tax=Tenacibaculum agarivorans TaxID=1908389 RepID=UPI0009FB74D6|nr:DUF4157 domain-containing protein [Tenacibaculum agarivorans]
MNSYFEKAKLDKAGIDSDNKKQQAIQLKDNREVTSKYKDTQSMIDRSSRVLQKKEKAEAISNVPIQRMENKTGLPDQLKSGIESLSGMDMSDTRVHYNSSVPAQLQAHAFAQGNNIHIAPGQEQHLPHEAWHVVQQKQGRVKETTQLKGKVAINDDEGLEREADVMGAKAMEGGTGEVTSLKSVSASGPVQRYITDNGWEISQNYAFALDGKELFAKKAQIKNSDRMLKLSGSKGSLIHLEAGREHTFPNNDVKMYKVEPELDTSVLDRQDEYGKHQHLKFQNRPDREMKLWRDCEKASEAVTGTQVNENRRTKIHGVLDENGNKVEKGLMYGPEDTAHALTAQIYMFNLGPFLDTKKDQDYNTYVDLSSSEANQELNLDPSYYNIQGSKATFTDMTQDPLKAILIYNKLLPEAKEEFDRFAQINDYASPEIGDSYVISTDNNLPDFDKGPNDKAWMFHWGGAIFKDGTDIATLESMSTGKPEDIDNKWYFAINGTKDDNGNINGASFHQIHLAQGTHGNKATTIAVSNRHTPKAARDFIKNDSIDLPGLEERLVQMEQNRESFDAGKDAWDASYVVKLNSVQSFIDGDNSVGLQDFHKYVFQDIKDELEALKARRDALEHPVAAQQQGGGLPALPQQVGGLPQPAQNAAQEQEDLNAAAAALIEAARIAHQNENDNSGDHVDAAQDQQNIGQQDVGQQGPVQIESHDFEDYDSILDF